ncbi:unnamed protein product [Camellia sinensis]
MGVVKLQLALLFLFVFIPVYGEELGFFELSLTWPNGFCVLRQCRDHIPQDFTLHGFWPYWQNGTQATYCPPIHELKRKDVEGIRGSLSTHWPNLLDSKAYGYKNEFQADFAFWKQQWTKHGTCSKLDPKTYFSIAMNLKNKINMLGALRSFGIQPSQRTYIVRDILLGIAETTTYNTVVDCFEVNDRKYWVIQEIKLCVTAAGHEFVSCERQYSIGCNGNNNYVYFSVEKNKYEERAIIFLLARSEFDVFGDTKKVGNLVTDIWLIKQMMKPSIFRVNLMHLDFLLIGKRMCFFFSAEVQDVKKQFHHFLNRMLGAKTTQPLMR